MSIEYKDFENAEEIWFWFCNSVTARIGGIRVRFGGYNKYIRKCEISDISRIIKELNMRGLITNRHLRVMSRWGMIGTPPYYDCRAKRSEIRLWEEGVLAFDKSLKQKGILQ